MWDVETGLFQRAADCAIRPHLPPLPACPLRVFPCSVPRQQAAADDVTTDYLGMAVERVQQLRWA